MSTHKEISGYKILGNLGEGEFGKVKYARRKTDGLEVAIKLIRKAQLSSDIQNSSKLMREIDILHALDHPNIVKLIDVIETEKYVGIVMEHCGGGELFDHILANDCLDENVARTFFIQLISGVCHLHSRNIVHRDLKLENLLLSKDKTLKIADMGFARNCSLTAYARPPSPTYNVGEKDQSATTDWFLKTSCGSPFYAAPELVANDSYYAPKADIWSCGIILYSMLAGHLPFDDDPDNPDGLNIAQLYRHITSAPLKFPENCSEAVKTLLAGILTLSVEERFGWNQVWNSEWVRSGEIDSTSKQRSRSFELSLPEPTKYQSLISPPISPAPEVQMAELCDKELPHLPLDAEDHHANPVEESKHLPRVPEELNLVAKVHADERKLRKEPLSILGKVWRTFSTRRRGSGGGGGGGGSVSTLMNRSRGQSTKKREETIPE